MSLVKMLKQINLTTNHEFSPCRLPPISQNLLYLLSKDVKDLTNTSYPIHYLR